jgi:hypothetical protein
MKNKISTIPDILIFDQNTSTLYSLDELEMCDNNGTRQFNIPIDKIVDRSEEKLFDFFFTN